MKNLNLGLRFLLELCLLGALAVWGFSLDSPLDWIVGLGAPLAAAAVWGLWIAPKSERRLRDPWRLVLELVLFVGAVTALGAAGYSALAAVFAFLVLLSEWLMHRWAQRDTA